MHLKLRFFIFFLLCLQLGPLGSAERQDLPSLGDSTSGIISLQQERLLGQKFLRSIRATTRTMDDPLMQDYLEHLIYRLASHSELSDKRLDMIIIKADSLNAFAAPGGIVGVNHGLFFYAETEHEISAILAHELAHLSQRHYARRQVSNKKAKAIGLAGLLAGIALMATTGSDAGLAAITSTQGYRQHEILKYSREREAEADRVGITTLAAADMDPYAMAYMFERLQAASRYSSASRIPEFLRTHPVTGSRISDAYNQSSKYPKKEHPLNLDYQLMRARAEAITSSDLNLAKQFQAGLEDEDPVQRVANRYGLVLALTQEFDLDGARQHLGVLRRAYPYNIAFRIAEADIHLVADQTEDAIALLEEALVLSPDNYPLSVKCAKAFIAAGKAHAALDLLKPLSISRPNDDHVWYLLAEGYGLARNIPKVHETRAEFFVLNGNFGQAMKQLSYALRLVEDNFQRTAKIEKRMEEIEQLAGG